jgi:hypothetical protein
MPTHYFDLDAAQSRIVRYSLMKAMILGIALMLCAPAHGEETTPNHRHGLVSRMACPAVREAVKLYGEAAAEQWARSHGVSASRIEEARRCLR